MFDASNEGFYLDELRSSCGPQLGEASLPLEALSVSSSSKLAPNPGRKPSAAAHSLTHLLVGAARRGAGVRLAGSA